MLEGLALMVPIEGASRGPSCRAVGATVQRDTRKTYYVN